MTFWQKIFRNPAPSADRRYSQLVTVLLHHQRLMGEIILQLPHCFDHQLQATMGLAWAGNQLVIRVNPDRLLVLRQDDAVLMLAHLALHVVWEHPARYTNYSDQELVAVATDIAVNQYLRGPPVLLSCGESFGGQFQKNLIRRNTCKLLMVPVKKNEKSCFMQWAVPMQEMLRKQLPSSQLKVMPGGLVVLK